MLSGTGIYKPYIYPPPRKKTTQMVFVKYTLQ